MHVAQKVEAELEVRDAGREFGGDSEEVMRLAGAILKVATGGSVISPFYISLV